MNTYFDNPEQRDAPKDRGRNKKMRVIFPDGTTFCFKRVTETFLESIRKIGPDQVAKLGLEVRHYPLVSREKAVLFGDDVRDLGDGWYVITQSDTTQKHHQLVSISNQLGLGLKVEVAAAFDTYEKRRLVKSRKAKEILVVSFPDGEVFNEEVPRDTYLKAIVKIGAERLAQKGLLFQNRQIVTRFPKYTKQQEVAKNQWVSLYSDTKTKAKVLNYIKDRMKLEFTVMDSIPEITDKHGISSITAETPVVSHPQSKPTTEESFRDTLFSDEDFL
ncbi:MAG: hypothetical protein IJ611_02905 [Bacteroidales bacterium]|nr:hypothetical protein [Bacteroidales bacterium]